MQTRLLLAATLVLPALVGATLLAPALVAEACGPYGAVRHSLAGRIVSERPASAGLELRARCGDDVFEAEVDEHGHFELHGLPKGSCVLEATARECYTWDRQAELLVNLPSEQVTIVIPSEDP